MYSAATEIRLAILFAFLAFVVWLVSRRVRTQSDILKLHIEGRNRLLDRFHDADAFLAFAQTEEGRAFLHPPELFASGVRTPPGLRLVQGGLFSLVLGAGFEYLGLTLSARANIGRGSFLDTHMAMDGQSYELIGMLLITAGVGLLVAGIVAWAWLRAGTKHARVPDSRPAV
jgi:hypothetical protein